MEHLFTLIIDHLPATFARIPGIAKAIAIPLLWVGPIAFTSKILMSRNALTGAAGNMVGGWVGKARGANNQWRSNMRKGGVARNLEGKSWGSKTPVGAIMKRVSMAEQGGVSLTRKGRETYAEARRQQLMATADKMVQQDGGRAGGDDDAMAIASRVTSGRDYVQRYAQRLRDTNPGMSEAQARQRAISSIASIEANFGAKVGSDAMRVAAFKARMGSNTSDANVDDGYIPMIEDAAQLIDAGLMTSIDAASTIKSNKMRADRSGVGFSTLNRTLLEAAGNYHHGRRGLQLTAMGAGINDHLRDDAIFGAEPGQIVGGRHEAVRMLAPRMGNRLREAVASQDHRAIENEMAAIAGKYDMLAQISPMKAQIFADNVMGQSIGNIPGYDEPVTIQKYLEDMRSARRDDGSTVDNTRFLQLRREYQQQNMAQQQAWAAQQAAAAASGQPPGPPGALPGMR